MARDDIAERGSDILCAGERGAFQKAGCVQRRTLLQQSTNGQRSRPVACIASSIAR
jgi:hypothetical protein